jgi:hypothetical protein
MIGDERMVVAVVARNPFCGRPSLPKELQGNEMASLRELQVIESLVCALSDWHDVGDAVDQYLLQGFETTYADRAELIRPFGTWSRIIE